MQASFIIGFHTKRLDNLLQTLRFLRKWHTDTIKECELVLVCQDTCEELFCPPEELRGAGWAQKKHFNLKLPHMHLPYVTNFGVGAADSDKLIILESDRILPPGYFADVIDQLEEGVQITTKQMKRPQQTHADKELEEDFEFKWEYRNETAKAGERNMWSGNTALMKSDYLKAGRMDEFYKGYGWADCDMTLTMEATGIQSVYRDEIEIHLWHEPATYGDRDQKEIFVNNGLYFCKKWGKPLPIWLREEVAEYRKTLI